MSATVNNERWLVTGATGQLGGHALFELRGMTDAPVLAMSRRAIPDNVRESLNVDAAVIDLADISSLTATIRAFRPTNVLHFGAMTAVSEAYAKPELANAVNVEASIAIAKIAEELESRMVFASTDMVFDGESAPYAEDAATKPLSNYGRSKAKAEESLVEFDHVAVARFPLMFGLPMIERASTCANQIQALRNSTPLNLFTDEYRTPLWLRDAATVSIALSRTSESGIFHFPGPARLSRLEIVEQFAEALGITTGQLNPISRLDIDSPEPRAKDLSLASERMDKVKIEPKPICAVTLSVEL